MATRGFVAGGGDDRGYRRLVIAATEEFDQAKAVAEGVGSAAKLLCLSPADRGGVDCLGRLAPSGQVRKRWEL